MLENNVISDIVRKLVDKYNSNIFDTMHNGKGDEYIIGSVVHSHDDLIYELQYIEIDVGKTNKQSKITYGIIDRKHDVSLLSYVHVNRSIREYDFRINAVNVLEKDIKAKSTNQHAFSI